MKHIYSNYLINNDGDEWVVLEVKTNKLKGNFKTYEEALQMWVGLDELNPHEQVLIGG